MPFPHQSGVEESWSRNLVSSWIEDAAWTVQEHQDRESLKDRTPESGELERDAPWKSAYCPNADHTCMWGNSITPKCWGGTAFEKNEGPELT